ncbi:MAG: two-component system response regulator [Arcobacter sp.]|nr:MAG: two-component system response regulator [Arcobacter sp.]
MNTNGMKILSIDENKDKLLLIQDYAKSLSLDVDSFEKIKQALTSAQNINYDLVILDEVSAKDNNWELIKAFRFKYSAVPIIVLIEPDTSVDLQVKALHFGAYDFLNKPVNSSLFQAKVLNALKLKKAEALLKDEIVLLENEIKEATQTFKDSEQEALKILGICAEYKEHKMSGHTLRVAHYSKVLAKAAGLNEKIQDVVFHASQFHDLGKLGIEESILLKEGKLNEEELEIMKTHSRLGYDILKYTQSAYLKAGAVISYSHHEKYDGSGYPIGLVGETIPIPGRIVAIAEVFDAVTHDRPYAKAWSIEEACQLLVEEKGRYFDPNLVDLFMENLDEMKSIQSKFP